MSTGIDIVTLDGKIKKEFTFIDLFAGIGGFRIALEQLGGKCVFSSEKDGHARKTYERNFGEVPKGDITNIPETAIPSFHFLSAGFPCQPFSYAGQLQGFGDKTRGTLFFEILRILQHHRPQMFLLENVKGLRSHQKGETLRIVLSQLEHLGYTVYWTVLDSLDFGLPQQRERWYCAGFSEQIHFEFPTGTSRKAVLRDIVDGSVADPALELSAFEKGRIDFHFSKCSIDAAEQIRVQHDNSKYAAHTKKGRYGVFSYLKKDKTLRFHVGDYAKTQIQEAYYCTLDSYSPAIIKARAPKLWDLRRHLSVLECQRLQGFPDDFVLGKQARQQLGNAVSVPVIQKIVEQMLKYEARKEPERRRISQRSTS